MQKITIIVPVYNCEKTIEKCIDSILKQTYKNFELIVINDGSVDKTLEILQGYNDSRIKIINQPNKGTGFARNIGLKNATGDYICFVDGDDFLEPDFLKISYELVKKYNAQIVACTYKTKNSRYRIDILDKVKGIEFLISLPEKIPMSVIGKIFDIRVLKNLWFDEKNNFEDIEFATKALLNVKKIVAFGDILYNYQFNINNETRSKFYNGNDRIIACLKALEYIKKQCPELVNDYITYTLLNGIAIVNMMIIHDDFNYELLNYVKKIVADNIEYVKHSKYNLIKKSQIYIFHKSFSLYKTIYGLIKR